MCGRRNPAALLRLLELVLELYHLHVAAGLRDGTRHRLLLSADEFVVLANAIAGMAVTTPLPASAAAAAKITSATAASSPTDDDRRSGSGRGSSGQLELKRETKNFAAAVPAGDRAAALRIRSVADASLRSGRLYLHLLDGLARLQKQDTLVDW